MTLGLVECGDVLGGHLQRASDFRPDATPGGVQFGLADPELIGRATVESVGIVAERSIAPGSYIGDDFPNGLDRARAIDNGPGQAVTQR